MSDDNQLRQALPSVASTIATRMVILIGGVAASVITARSLGPAGRGSYYYVITLAAMTAQFANLGLHASNTVLVSRDPGLFPRLAGNSVYVSVLLGTIIAGCVVAVCAMFQPATVDWHWLLFAIPLVPALVLNLLLSNLFVGIGRIRAFNAVQIAVSVTALGSIALGALAGASAYAFIALTTAANVVVAVGLVAWLYARRQLALRPDAGLLKSGLTLSLRAFLVNTLSFLVLRSNVLVLGHSGAGTELGYYSIGAQVFDVATLVPISIATVLFPVFARSGGAWRSLRDSVRRVALAMGILCAVGGSLTPFAVPFLFGEAFRPAIAVTLALLPGSWAFGLISIISQHLAVHGFPRVQVWTWLAALVSLWAAAPYAAAQSGAIGAAVMLSAVSIIVLGVLYRAASRYRQLPNSQDERS